MVKRKDAAQLLIKLDRAACRIVWDEIPNISVRQASFD